MKKPTPLPSLEGTEQHLSVVKTVILIILAAAGIVMLLSPWSN